MNKRGKPSIWALILAVFFLYFCYVLIDQQKVIMARESEIARIQEKIGEEQMTNEELTKQREIINSDEYVEKVAREKLGMVKKEERIFIDINK